LAKIFIKTGISKFVSPSTGFVNIKILGFLDDLRRLNVAITRAKRKLIIVGDVKTLNSNKTYKRMIEYFKNNGILRGIDEFR